MRFPIQKIRFPIPFPTETPSEIYFQGNLELLQRLPQRGLAVVGTRRPQPRSEALVRKILFELRRENLIIVSGLALGIDSAAHRSALDAGLPTIAVLGCGLDLQYPPENEPLRQKILEAGGLVLSEYAPGVEALPFFFIRRNRIIAGLAQASWIVQAPQRSGALNTASWTRKFMRTTYVTGSFPGDPAFSGTEDLYNYIDHPPKPLYNASSLKDTWLECHDLSPRLRKNSRKNSDADVILEELKCRSAQAGGVAISDLLDWAVRCGFTPLDLFERLQKAQQCGLVSERNGILVAT